MGKEVMGKKENEMAQEKERPAGSQSLFRGLMLIEILSNYPNGCPLAHLSELAGLNKSTVHRLLQGLQSCGYVTPAPAAGSYRLTTKFIAVGQKALSSLNIIHVAAPHLEALNIATGETINFSSREDDHAILIYKLEPTTGMLRTRAYIGQHMPLYCSAMGKIYMAFGHADYVEAYWESHQDLIQPLTRNTITGLPNNNLFISKKNVAGKWEKPYILDGEINTVIDDEGVCSFSSDGKIMYFTRARQVLDRQVGVEIYSSNRAGGTWSAPQKIKIFADTTVSVAHPAFSSDGQTLYFVSDASKGKGGKD